MPEAGSFLALQRAFRVGYRAHMASDAPPPETPGPGAADSPPEAPAKTALPILSSEPAASTETPMVEAAPADVAASAVTTVRPASEAASVTAEAKKPTGETAASQADKAQASKAAAAHADDEEEPAEAAAPVEPGVWPWLRERYFSLDRRMLGVFRIYFGLLLLVDVLRRIPDSTFFYSNDGILSNHFSLYSPMIRPYFSLYTAFSTPLEVKVAFVLTALAYVPYIIGYRTRLFQIIAFVLYTSLNARNHFLENGGCVMVALVACWSMFMPLGDRFSVDAVLKSLRARQDHTAAALNDREGIEPDRTLHVSLVTLVVLLQVAVCYFFNTIHKTGATWRSGEAVHWVLWQNRIATHLTDFIRMHEPRGMSWLLSKSTLLIEGGAPLLVLSPFFFRQARPLHFFLTTGLHLSIAAMMTLGPFSYVMVALNMLVLTPNVFDWLSDQLEKGRTERTVVYDPRDAGLHWVARILSRLDTFELLHFVDTADLKSRPAGAPKASIATLDEGTGDWQVGTAAIASATRSLPLGQVWGALLGGGPGQALLRALLRRRTRLVDSYGIEAGRRFDAPGFASDPADPLPPWRQQLRQTLVALRESMVGVMFLAAFFQVMHDNWKIPAHLRMDVPRVLAPLNLYPRLLQGWSMFSPDAPRSDGTIVVDAVTADGRHLDPFTGKAPDFDAPLHGPWYQSQFWCDYFLKITFDGNKGYRDELKKYLLNWQTIEGRPASDKIVSFEVWWVTNDSPPPGSTQVRNIQKKLVLSGR